MAATISPRSAAWVLMQELTEAGWGDLAGRRFGGQRAVLQCIARLTGRQRDGRSREDLTAEQVANGASLSERWTRWCLQALEERGLITWHRGYIDEAGRPQPGSIRINRRRLYELVMLARPIRAAAEVAHAAATRARIAARNLRRTKHRPGQTRRSEGPELSAGPLPGRGRAGALTRTAPPPEPDFARDTRGAARAWAALRGRPPA